ncbi:MAG: hypothetical protein K0R14_1252 [Burkholderiales bacterium]|jgi:hypothetical protein|nr:hypothetical protein [Burkholderiales bacterium]
MKLFIKHLKKIFVFLGSLFIIRHSIALGPWPDLSWYLQYGNAQFPSDSFTDGNGISISNSGNVYTIGTTTGSLHNQRQNGHDDYWISSYDSDGRFNWARQVGSSGGFTHGASISTDSNGNIYAVGDTDVGISNITKRTLSTDFFITKYSSDGTELWTKLAGGESQTDITQATAITTDKEGNSYVIGNTNVSVLKKPKIGTADYFIAKYDTTGKNIWAKQVGEPEASSYAKAIALDNKGHLYVTGLSHHDNLKVDHLIVAEYKTENGELIGQKSISNPDGTHIYGSAITVDNVGNVYVAGTTGIGAIGGQMVNRYFIIKYSNDMSSLWTTVSTSTTTYGSGIGTDTLGNSYLIGNTEVALPGQEQKSEIDYFIAKYNAKGQLVKSIQIGGARLGLVLGSGMYIDNNNIYLVGDTTTGLYNMPMMGHMDYFIVKYKNIN